MKIFARFLLSFWVAFGLSACNLPIPANPAGTGQEVAQQYQTISVLLTATAQSGSVAAQEQTAPVPTPSPGDNMITPLPGDKISPTPLATEVLATQDLVTKTPTLRCDLAHPGRPIDVTIPDESSFHPGDYFSKTWRLVNAGACPWTTEYSMIWFSGDDLGVNHTQPFNAEIAPGKTVDVTMDMVAPQAPGTYQSNWKLRNNHGDLFGIGPNGDAPFWVRIVVLPVDTPTVTPTVGAPTVIAPTVAPTATATPVVILHGTAALVLAEGFDLDQGKVNQGVKDDLVFQQPQGGKHQLAPVNGARMAPFGTSAPRFEECQAAALVNTPLELDQYLPGTYFCSRTNEGLPGWFLLSLDPAKTNQLSLEFLTWAVP